MNYPLNQFSPNYFAGVNQPPPGQVAYQDKPYIYVYSPPNGQLSASQTPFIDTLAIQPDSDFLLMAWYISQYTGAFQIQLSDSTGYQLSNGLINSGSISQSQSDPTVFVPWHPFPASGKILINIGDLSGAPNPLQIAFMGSKRFRVQSR